MSWPYDARVPDPTCPRCAYTFHVPHDVCPGCDLDLGAWKPGSGGVRHPEAPVLGREHVPLVQFFARVAGAIVVLSSTALTIGADPPWALIENGLGLIAIWIAIRICRFGFHRGVLGLLAMVQRLRRRPTDDEFV